MRTALFGFGSGVAKMMLRRRHRHRRPLMVGSRWTPHCGSSCVYVRFVYALRSVVILYVCCVIEKLFIQRLLFLEKKRQLYVWHAPKSHGQQKKLNS
ncbi:hypothetical protein BpHYR1_005867 [Brachionus plicatilis]|uniref:Uncharacterized protein n=1 Tax=Brachionus plicatilis TaxID=10195 RepID=A0A3M7TA62_BRAPC|nr:hypothetical protein BpHYR1_005867 [Brachionus plicatilis]